MADVLMPSIPKTDILSPAIQTSMTRVRVTTIRLTPSDQKIVDGLTELTGQQMSSLIRYALRRVLWDVERAARGETPDNRTTSPVREKGR